jgi:hypothetical protein
VVEEGAAGEDLAEEVAVADLTSPVLTMAMDTVVTPVTEALVVMGVQAGDGVDTVGVIQRMDLGWDLDWDMDLVTEWDTVVMDTAIHITDTTLTTDFLPTPTQAPSPTGLLRMVRPLMVPHLTTRHHTTRLQTVLLLMVRTQVTRPGLLPLLVTPRRLRVCRQASMA